MKQVKYTNILNTNDMLWEPPIGPGFSPDGKAPQFTQSWVFKDNKFAKQSRGTGHFTQREEHVQMHWGGSKLGTPMGGKGELEESGQKYEGMLLASTWGPGRCSSLGIQEVRDLSKYNQQPEVDRKLVTDDCKEFRKLEIEMALGQQGHSQLG